MKILHVNEHLARRGGVETYLLSVLPMLEQRGMAQHVAYAEGDSAEYASSTCIPGIKAAGFLKQSDVKSQMTSLLERERPDVTHIHNFRNVGAVQACLDYGPTVMTTHDYRTVCPASTLFYKNTREVCPRTCGPACFTTTLTKHCLTPRPGYAAYYYHRARWSTRNAGRYARVIAPSTGARDRLVQAGFKGRDVAVLPYFCPMEVADSPRPIPEQPTITYIGRIAPNKGHEFFVRALGQLPSDVRGVMVGSITEEVGNDLMELAAESGAGGRLRLRKWASRQEIRDILDETTVFVFPSLWPETLGIVGLEALARGVPVVASDIGGVREWLRNEDNGLLVQPKQPSQIKDAVLRIAESHESLLQYGRRGIETVRERFLPRQHVDRLIQLYEATASAD